MKLQEAIDLRRSVREFENRKVPRKIIKKLIKNAVKAPSACNRQPWIFYCVDSKEKRDKVSRLLYQAFLGVADQTKLKSKESQKVANKFYVDMGGARNVIFIFREKKENEAIHVEPNDIKSISSAAQNLILSALENGLGTCWIGTFNGPSTEKKLKSILHVPQNLSLIASIILGYPKPGYKPLKKKNKKLNEIIKFV
jgi:nitroreductase